MRDENRSRSPELATWHRDQLPEHAPVEARLPVAENSVTQIAPGPYGSGATIVSNTEVTAVHGIVRSRSVGVVTLKQGYTGFYIPLRWAGELKINGVIATPSAMHMPEEEVSYHVRGQERAMLGCILPRIRFVETLAALRGEDPEKLTLHERALELSPAASNRLRRRLAAILDKARRGELQTTSGGAPFDLTSVLFELVLDAYLDGRPEPMRKSGRVCNPGRIVRAAEERFAQAGPNPVSLADLCVAAGVSKSALYLAFESWCSEPPIAYFHKRRLAQARSRLLNTEHRRGAVKNAALSVGLTELGRFSNDYRWLFGESPSTTLSRSVI